MGLWLDIVGEVDCEYHAMSSRVVFHVELPIDISLRAEALCH